MANEWCRKNDGDPSDKQIAATMAAALIGQGFTLQTADNVAMAADQAVELYCAVLSKLSSLDVPGERTGTQVQAASTEEQEEMDALGVTRIDAAKFCYREYRYDNLSDALRYARASSGAT
jgi:hypothetical protein